MTNLRINTKASRSQLTKAVSSLHPMNPNGSGLTAQYDTFNVAAKTINTLTPTKIYWQGTVTAYENEFWHTHIVSGACFLSRREK